MNTVDEVLRMCDVTARTGEQFSAAYTTGKRQWHEGSYTTHHGPVFIVRFRIVCIDGETRLYFRPWEITGPKRMDMVRIIERVVDYQVLEEDLPDAIAAEFAHEPTVPIFCEGLRAAENLCHHVTETHKRHRRDESDTDDYERPTKRARVASSSSSTRLSSSVDK